MRARHGDKGYTFIELLVAITMLAIIAIPLAALFTACFAGTARAGNRTAAANLCRDRMEAIKAAGCCYLDGITANPEGLYLEIEELPGSFCRETRLRCIDLALEGECLSAPLVHVAVSVTWCERGRERTVEMESYLAQR